MVNRKWVERCVVEMADSFFSRTDVAHTGDDMLFYSPSILDKVCSYSTCAGVGESKDILDSTICGCGD